MDNPDDFVRIELRTALQRGIRVVPVLLDGTPMPQAAELPDDLAPLVRRNGMELEFKRFDSDTDRLISDLRGIIKLKTVQLPWKGVGGAAAGLAVVAGVWWFGFGPGIATPVRPVDTTPAQTPAAASAPVAPVVSAAAGVRSNDLPPAAPKPSANPVAGTTIQDCPQCPEMVVVPAGSYLRGSPTTEADRYSNEGPQRRVTIAAAFAVGRHEVTIDQWDACVTAGGCSHRPSDQGWGRGRRPVINVSWHDAQQYVTWLSKFTGKRYGLLSEAQWEYVARAGTQTPFWTGMTISTDQANYNGKYVYGSGVVGAYRQKTVPVDELPNSRNPWGLTHVHGNVWEWVQDCYQNSYDGLPVDGSAWEYGECKGRVLRGGSWSNDPRNLRSASRGSVTPDFRNDYIGLRVARMLP